MLSPTVYDTFNRTVSGGWGTSLSGHSWTATVGADSSVGPPSSNVPGLGAHVLNTTGVRICVVGPNVADSDVRFGFAVDNLATGAALYAGTVARYTDASNHYYFRIDCNTDQTMGWRIFKRVAAVDTSLGSGTISGLTHSASARYWARAKVTGTTLQFKVWSDATGEPLTWTATITDSAISAAGQVGPRSERPAGNSSGGVNASYSYFTRDPYADAAGKALPYDLEVAWGADLTADASTWKWTVITSDVYQGDPNDPENINKPSIFTTFGRSDWAGQAEPANLAATLNGIGGRYAAYTPASPNYPNVVRGTPVRERICYNIVRFLGFANGFPPTWDLVTNQPTVALTASGSLRRLGQGTTPLRSPLTRSILATTAATLRQYWPCEDGTGSTQAASGLVSGTPLAAIRPVGFADYDPTNPHLLQYTTGIVIGSGRLPQLKSGGKLSATFPAGSSSSWTVQVMTFIDMISDVSATGNAGEVLTAYEWSCPGSTFPRWQLICDSTAAAAGINPVRVMAINTSGVATEVARLVARMAGTAEIRVDASQSGGNINVTLKGIAIDTVYTNSGSVAGTLAGVAGFTADPNQSGYAADFVLGHIRVWDGNTAPDFLSITSAPTAWNAYNGETAMTRLTRLCGEQGVPLTLTGTSTTTMGPQPVAAFLDLLRECEAADNGQLYDGQGSGLGYIARAARYTLTASLTVDASQEQLSAPFQPQDDDQQIRNRWTVTRSNGSYAVASDDDPTDPLSTKRAGVYQDQATLNLGDDGQLVNQSAWRVHVGTNQGFRYPTLPVDLFRNPEIAGPWLDVDLLNRVDVVNLPAPHPPGTLSLVVNGYSEALGDFAWDVVANCSPYQPWNVYALDTNFPLEADGQTLNSSLAPGALTMSVATAAGKPLLSTAAGDYPQDFNVGGWQIHATAVSGGSSPQTATITAAPNTTTIPGGTALTLWNSPVLGF